MVCASTPSIYAGAARAHRIDRDSLVGSRFRQCLCQVTKYAAERLTSRRIMPGLYRRDPAAAIVVRTTSSLLPRILRGGARTLSAARRRSADRTGLTCATPRLVFVAADRHLAVAGGQAITIRRRSATGPRIVWQAIRPHRNVCFVAVPTGLAMTLAGAMEQVAALASSADPERSRLRATA